LSRLQTSFILGYHGCDKSFGRKAVNGEVQLKPSSRSYDWLGGGIYFWESDYMRALEWAQGKASRGDYKEPYVIGAVIDLGNCLDLTQRENIELVRSAAKAFEAVQKKSGFEMPVNQPAPKDPSPDLVMRYLDCAVMNHLHTVIKTTPDSPISPFDTVRAIFGEGVPIYPGSGFREKTHSQIAVINRDCIKGVFLPIIPK
jgi:hypothetical protein